MTEAVSYGTAKSPPQARSRHAAGRGAVRGAKRTGPVIALRHISKTYRSGTGEVVEVLKDVNFEIEPGSFTVIRGESGSGKTTLLRVLGLLDSDFEGSYAFAGDEVKAHPDWYLDELRSNNIGFIFQEGRLFAHLNVGENITLPVRLRGAAEQRHRVKQAVAEMASGFFTRREIRDDILSNRPAQVSGGQRQRASIMRAVINRPSVILADEPTASLDESRKREILVLLQSFCAAGHTVIVVSHDKVFYDAGRQLELTQGKLREVAAGEPGRTGVGESWLGHIREPETGASILYGWKPTAPVSILIRQAARETFLRPIFLFLILISLCVGVCQVSVFSSVIIGAQAFVEDAMTRGSRLNRLQIKPRIADLSKEDRFPVAAEIAAWPNVQAVVPRRQTVARLANIRGEQIPYVAMGLHPDDPEYGLLDFVAGGPFAPSNEELEVIVTVGLLQDLFDTTGLAEGTKGYEEFIGEKVSMIVPSYSASGDLVKEAPVSLSVTGIVLHAEGGRQIYLPNRTQLVFDQFKMDRTGTLAMPISPGGEWTDRAEVARLADFPWEDQLHVYSSEIREIIPVFRELSKLGYKPESDIWDFKWVLDVQDLAWRIFLPLLILIVGAVALTVATNIFSSAKLRETELALWRILGMRRGDLVATQVISTAFMILLGSAIGLVIAAGLVRGARAFLEQQHEGENFQMVFAPVSQFAVAILVLAMIIGVLSAIYPAVRTANADPARVLQS